MGERADDDEQCGELTMSWIRLDDTVPLHPKLLAVGPAACWLWVCAIGYCQRHSSDGFVPEAAMRHLGVRKPTASCDLLVRYKLLERVEGGYRVHDYLDHNLSRDERLARTAQHHDKKVVAGRRGAEKRWGTRSKQIAEVLPETDSRNSKPIAERNSTGIAPSPPLLDLSLKEQERDLRADSKSAISDASLSLAQQFRDERRDPFTDARVTERAARFVERYTAMYPEHRKGARYTVKPVRDYAAAVTLCETWSDDARLDKLAIVFLTSNHAFAREGSRTIPQFLALASWCDGQLAEWEAKEHAR